MKQANLSFILLLFAASLHIINASHIIVTPDQRHSGRFGDQLYTYICAQWVLYHLQKTNPSYTATFLYKPFTQAEKFVLHTAHPRFSPTLAKQATRTIKVSLTQDIKASCDHKIASVPNPLVNLKTLYAVTVGRPDINHYDHPEFKRKMQELIRPKTPVAIIPIPKDRVSIAIHVRRGGGLDKAYARQIFPSKFPPDQYYIAALKHITANIDTNIPLYIYIFTDDPNPEKIAATLQQATPDHDALFDWRKQNTKYQSNEIEDFFSLPTFDCLIRPWSNFSRVGEIIGNHAIVASVDAVVAKKKISTLRCHIRTTKDHDLWKKIDKTPFCNETITVKISY